jgi:hypothetical protein
MKSCLPAGKLAGFFYLPSALSNRIFPADSNFFEKKATARVTGRK